MAAHFWRLVLGVKLAFAIGAACVARAFTPELRVGFSCAIAACTFVAVEYLLGFGVIFLSRALPPRATRRSAARDALHAAFSEPIHFARAQFAMAAGTLVTTDVVPAGAPRRGPLLLVHGFACNSSVWRTLLPHLRALGFHPIRALDLVPFASDVELFAVEFGRELAALQRRADGAAITVLAHSMGGLVCRAAMRDRDPGLVRRLVTIATPHRGAVLAQLLRVPPADQLRTDSRWLAVLNTAPRGEPSFPIESLYSLDDNFVTPASSAELPGARLYPVSGLGHFGLLFSRRGMDAALRVLREAA